MKRAMFFGSFLVGALAAFGANPWTGEWIDVTPANGVKDDYYPLQADPAKCSFRFRVSRTLENTIGVEAYVRDDKVVVDDCAPGSLSCPTWKDDCLEVFFDGDGDRNPNTRGPDWNENPTPCNAGGEYAIAANGATQSDYASAKKCFGRAWGGTAEPWTENGRRVGTHYDLWFGWECLNRPAPRPDEPVKFGFTICVHDDDDGKACDYALYWKGNPKYPFADESAFGEIELPAIAAAPVQEPFSPIVPVMLAAETAELLAKDLRRMREEFGFRRFILVGPDSFRWFGKADLACFEAIGRKIAVIKAALADTDVKIGWWCDPTFHANDAEPWQRIMDYDGHLTGSVCPLDAGHVADFARKLCTGLRIARPDPIFIEDDFTLSNHGGMNAMKGCFCPLHMKAYEAKVGRAYTPIEVATMFRKPTKENEPLRQAWADMSRESLVSFAAAVRREIDKVAPETRVCQCQSGFVDIDGDSTEAVARAWAGKNRPLSRLFGAGYWDENPPMNVAANVAHVFWSAQHLPADFELLHETDAYPHTRFYNSSLFLVSEFAGALMAGVHDSYYYCLQYTDDPLSDTGYVARMREFAPRFAAARALRLGGRPVGVRMVYTPKEAYMVRETTRPASCGMLTASTIFLTKLGFPIVTREDAPVATLFGNTPNVLSDDEIRELLKGGLFLDGEAAEILTKRGFADLIGASAADDVDTRVQYATERILPPAGSTFRGRGVFTRRIKSKPIIGWTPPHSVFAVLNPKPGAAVWSAYYDIDGKEVAPAVLFFENGLGGRVGVMAQSVDVKPPHMSLYTPRKQELFHNLFAKLAQDRIAVRAPKTPNTYVLASEKDGELLVMANNLAGEPRDDFALHFASDWVGGTVSRLTADGSRERIGTATADFVLPAGSLPPMTPEFYVVERRK